MSEPHAPSYYAASAIGMEDHPRLDGDRAADILGRLCEIAAGEGMRGSIEFCQRRPGCKTIHAAKAVASRFNRSETARPACSNAVA